MVTQIIYKINNPLRLIKVMANNDSYVVFFSYIVASLVVLLVYVHLGVFYGIMLLEIIIFIFKLLS